MKVLWAEALALLIAVSPAAPRGQSASCPDVFSNSVGGAALAAWPPEITKTDSPRRGIHDALPRVARRNAGASARSVARLGASAADADAYEVLHEFSMEEGNAGAPLLQTTDGKFYGTSSTGGFSGQGSVFVLTPSGNGEFTFTTLHSFEGPDGDFLNGALVLGPGGDFYGATYGGGANFAGTVFKITPAGTLTSLHSFATAEGTHPIAFILGNDGAFYGTAQQGGSSGNGTVFRITSAGTLTTVHEFDGTDGALPRNLMQASDGNFYGTTTVAGPGSDGTIFRLTPSGT